MADTAARMLALLGLLQARSDWSGAELAERLGVTDRTIRNDVDRLRGLGYPVDAVRGPGGRYRLGVGTKLPPLLLEEDEAVAVAVGLRAGTACAGIEETSARALAKLEHVLPHRLQRRVNALRDAVSAGPENTGSNVDDPVVDPALLSEVAGAVRDHVELRFDYTAPRTSRLQLEPYRLVSWQRRWFVVARDAGTDSWAPYRLDWMTLRAPPAAGSPRSRCRARTTRRSCCARWRSPGGPCTPGSTWTPRPRTCSPGSTRLSAWSRAWTRTTASWSRAPTAWR